MQQQQQQAPPLAVPAATPAAAGQSRGAEAGLLPGQLVANKWRLVQRIGRGAFGDIFIGTCEDEPHPGQHFAMKLEKLPAPPLLDESGAPLEENEAERQKAQAAAAARAVLKLEAVILSKLQSGRFVEYGRDLDLSVAYLMMSLLGENLLRLRRRRQDAKFTLPTILRFGIQAIRCIQAVHEIGFLHRDIKPSNFVIGSNRNTIHGNMASGGPASPDHTTSRTQEEEFFSPSKIFIIDFGLARAYRDRTTGAVLPSRGIIKGFRGTPRYASLHVHREEDLGRRDDLWSLLYILVEFATGDLPWGAKRDKDEIGKLKEQFMSLKLLRTGRPGECPSCFIPFMKHLYSLRFESKPNYAYLIELLQHKLKKMGYGHCEGDGSPTAQGGDVPFDWEDCSTASTNDASLAPPTRSLVELSPVQAKHVGMAFGEDGLPLQRVPMHAAATSLPPQLPLSSSSIPSASPHHAASTLPFATFIPLASVQTAIPSAIDLAGTLIVPAPEPALLPTAAIPPLASSSLEPDHITPPPATVSSPLGLPLSQPIPVPDTVILSPRKHARARTASDANPASKPPAAEAVPMLKPPLHPATALKIALNTESTGLASAKASPKLAPTAAIVEPTPSPVDGELEDLRADLAKQRTALHLTDDVSRCLLASPTGQEFPDWNGAPTPRMEGTQRGHSRARSITRLASPIEEHAAESVVAADEDDPECRGDGRTLAVAHAEHAPQHSLNDAYVLSVAPDASLAAAPGETLNWNVDLAGDHARISSLFVLAPMFTTEAAFLPHGSPDRGWPQESPAATPQRATRPVGFGSMLADDDDTTTNSSTHDSSNDSSEDEFRPSIALHSPPKLRGLSLSAASSSVPATPHSAIGLLTRTHARAGSVDLPPHSDASSLLHAAPPLALAPLSPRTFRPSPPDLPPPAYSTLQRSFGRFKGRAERSPAKPLSRQQVDALEIRTDPSQHQPAEAAAPPN